MKTFPNNRSFICYEDISLHSHFYLFLLLGVRHSRCGFVEIPGVLLVTLTVCYVVFPPRPYPGTPEQEWDV